MTAAEIEAVRFKATSDRIMTLGDLCDLVAGRATVVLELKSHFDGDRRLVQRSRARAGELCRAGGGDVVRSRHDRRWSAGSRPHMTRGIVAERHYAHHEWDRFSRRGKSAAWRSCLHAGPHPAAFRRLWGERPAGGGACLSPARSSACRC